MSFRSFLIASALLLCSSAGATDLLILLDPARIDRAVAQRGAGPDGRMVRPRAVVSACLRDKVFSIAAYSPQGDRCRAADAVPGLRDAIDGLTVTDRQPSRTVLELINAGGIAVVLPSRRLACEPGRCNRAVFEGISYPIGLIGRPQPEPLPAPQITQFSVQPKELIVGQSATLYWTVEAARSCDLTASGNPMRLSVDAMDQLTVSPLVDTVWTLTCAGPGGSAIEQIVTAVTPPAAAPDILLFASSRSDVPAGARTRLIWDSRQASTCSIDNGSDSIAVPSRGQRRLSVDQDTRFRLSCENGAGLASSTVDVLATSADQAPTIEGFEADRDQIDRGDALFVSWRAADTSRCRLRDPQQNAAWNLPEEGRFKLVPTETTSYTLDCRNAYGSDRADLTVTVSESDVTLRILSFDLSEWTSEPRNHSGQAPLRLKGHGLIRASWATTDASICRLGDDTGRVIAVPVNGNRIIRVDESSALQINCFAQGAEVQAIQQVDVVGDLIHLDEFER